MPSSAEIRSPVVFSHCAFSRAASSVTGAELSLARLISTQKLFCVVRCGWPASIAAITLSTLRP